MVPVPLNLEMLSVSPCMPLVQSVVQSVVGEAALHMNWKAYLETIDSWMISTLRLQVSQGSHPESAVIPKYQTALLIYLLM